jgi:hypothetical protein
VANTGAGHVSISVLGAMVYVFMQDWSGTH